MTKRAVNENVTITGWYFRKRQGLATYPKRMVYGGATYTFLDSGLQYLIRKGEQVTRLFDVSDGHTQYRLRCDGDQSSWTLVAITEHA